MPPAKPVPKKRVPRPSVDKGESEVHLSSPPPVLEETETAATNHSSQPEPLQEIPAEKKEEEKEKEMPQKANTTESQDDLAKPVSQPVSATPLKFNKPPAPRKPRGGQSATNTSHKPMPVPRPRTGVWCNLLEPRQEARGKELAGGLPLQVWAPEESHQYR